MRKKEKRKEWRVRRFIFNEYSPRFFQTLLFGAGRWVVGRKKKNSFLFVPFLYFFWSFSYLIPCILERIPLIYGLRFRLLFFARDTLPNEPGEGRYHLVQTWPDKLRFLILRTTILYHFINSLVVLFHFQHFQLSKVFELPKNQNFKVHRIQIATTLTSNFSVLIFCVKFTQSYQQKSMCSFCVGTQRRWHFWANL